MINRKVLVELRTTSTFFCEAMAYYSLKISSVATVNSGNLVEEIISPSMIGGRAGICHFQVQTG